jgi:hypothetical protein
MTSICGLVRISPCFPSHGKKRTIYTLRFNYASERSQGSTIHLIVHRFKTLILFIDSQNGSRTSIYVVTDRRNKISDTSKINLDSGVYT